MESNPKVQGGLTGSNSENVAPDSEINDKESTRKRPVVEDEEENPWRKAARIRWEKHRQAQALGLVVSSSTSRKSKKEEDSDEDGNYGLEGPELESFKTMCSSIFSRCNKLASSRRKKIERFLAGRYDASATGKEEVMLNEEKMMHPENGQPIKEVISFEMDYGLRQWRRIKRRWMLDQSRERKDVEGSDSAE